MPPKQPHSIREILGKYIALGNQYFNVVINLIPTSLAIILGSVFLILAILVLILIECPGYELSRGLRLMFSIALALLASAVIGLKEEQAHEKTERMRMKWQGVATLGIFLITYLVNPSSILAFNPCAGGLELYGRVLLANRPLANAKIGLPEIQVEGRTNSLGSFHLELEQSQLSNEPLRMEVKYGKWDTTILLDLENNPSPLTIDLPDTLVELTNEIIESAIWEHLNEFQEWISNEHLAWLNKGGRSCELKEIVQESRTYENEPPKGHNPHMYYRRNETLDSQTKIKKAGISIEPFESQYKHQLDRINAFIWAPEKVFESGDKEFYLEYAMENKGQLGFVVNGSEKISQNQYEITVTYRNPVRMVYAILEFGSYVPNHKRRKVHYYGVFPKEKHTLKFIQGRWHWVGVQRIDNPLPL